MVSMETIKMKGKGVHRSWLRGANLLVEMCVWGSGDFACLALLRSERNLLKSSELVFKASLLFLAPARLHKNLICR